MSIVLTAKCQGPAPLGVGTMTAREPTMKVTRAQQQVSQNSHVIAKRCFTIRETAFLSERNDVLQKEILYIVRKGFYIKRQ
jgi:hypothetical protein